MPNSGHASSLRTRVSLPRTFTSFAPRRVWPRSCAAWSTAQRWGKRSASAAGSRSSSRSRWATRPAAGGSCPLLRRFFCAIRRRPQASMPKLSLIESEAARLVRRVPETSRRALQQALIDLCEAHWLELRGPEPATPLAHALWSVAPPCADLLADLVAAGDGRLLGLLGTKAAQGFALLVLAEIERGNAEGIRLAHEPM